MEGSSSHAGLSGWKRLFLIAFGIGVGVVLSGALLIGVYVWYSERPKPWNTTAIIATYQGVDSATNRTVAQSERKDWVRFYYIFKNTTEADYQLDSISSRLMASLKDTGSLLHAPELDTGMVMSLESGTSRGGVPRLVEGGGGRLKSSYATFSLFEAETSRPRRAASVQSSW